MNPKKTNIQPRNSLLAIIYNIGNMIDTRTWEILDEEDIEKIYREAGSVAWFQVSIQYLLSHIKELKGVPNETYENP